MKIKMKNWAARYMTNNYTERSPGTVTMHAQSKHIKGSKEHYLLGQDKNPNKY